LLSVRVRVFTQSRKLRWWPGERGIVFGTSGRSLISGSPPMLRVRRP